MSQTSFQVVDLEASTDTGPSLLSKFFRALGDNNRLRLLEFILAKERNVSECVEHLDLSQGRVSIHLACLADCGFIESRRDGRWNYYRVTDPRVSDLVMLARSLATDNCAPLEKCERIDDPANQPAKAVTK